MFFPHGKKRYIQSVAQSLLPTKVAGGTLRDDNKNGCVADYCFAGVSLKPETPPEYPQDTPPSTFNYKNGKKITKPKNP